MFKSFKGANGGLLVHLLRKAEHRDSIPVNTWKDNSRVASTLRLWYRPLIDSSIAWACRAVGQQAGISWREWWTITAVWSSRWWRHIGSRGSDVCHHGVTQQAFHIFSLSIKITCTCLHNSIPAVSCGIWDVSFQVFFVYCEKIDTLELNTSLYFLHQKYLHCFSYWRRLNSTPPPLQPDRKMIKRLTFEIIWQLASATTTFSLKVVVEWRWRTPLHAKLTLPHERTLLSIKKIRYS